jgi:hypothetical protein
MSTTATPDLEQYIQGKITSGEFASREQFALEAIQLYRDIELEYFDALRDEVQRRIAEVRRGDVAPLDVEAIIAKGRELLAKKRQAG